MSGNNIDGTLTTVGQPTEGGCVYTNFNDEFTLPTSAEEELGEGWVSLGDVSPDGFTESKSISTTPQKNWGGDTVRTTRDSETIKYKIAYIEVNRASVAKTRYGVDNVETDSDGNITHISGKPDQGKPLPYVIDELESEGSLRRTVIPRADISSFDDVPHKKGQLMVYGCELEAQKVAGSKFNVYRAKPSKGYPEGDPANSWTKAQLLAWCAANGVTADESMTKDQILEAITNAS